MYLVETRPLNYYNSCALLLWLVSYIRGFSVVDTQGVQLDYSTFKDDECEEKLTHLLNEIDEAKITGT